MFIKEKYTGKSFYFYIKIDKCMLKIITNYYVYKFIIHK